MTKSRLWDSTDPWDDADDTWDAALVPAAAGGYVAGPRRRRLKPPVEIQEDELALVSVMMLAAVED